MYFRWRDERIIVKTTIWGTMEGDGRQSLQHLAAAVRARASAHETPQPDAGPSTGITRNGAVQQVDEPDRKFSLFFCHLPGDRGAFRDHPVDYKCVAPHAPVRGNRAFDTALESTDGVLMILRGGADGIEKARHAADDLVRRLAERHSLSTDGSRASDMEALFGPGGPVALTILLIDADSTHHDVPSLQDALALPDSVDIVKQDPAEPLASAARAFGALTDALQPRLGQAADAGRLPI